ncbi:hypothetical protein [Campylobacter canadensis]|uniref:hypothetical protein n=1 Tax=Campylobacter canadensis TaxID=449520 RepID=UPI001CC91CC0|nr:hypothetical protein [Campylobacter canadensis]MBZ8002383.1 hypothetical protein [Campylobacter canadensis]
MKRYIILLLCTSFSFADILFQEINIKEYSTKLSNSNDITFNKIANEEYPNYLTETKTYTELKKDKDNKKIIINNDTIVYNKNQNSSEIHNDLLDIILKNSENIKNIDKEKIVFLINLLKIK